MRDKNKKLILGFGFDSDDDHIRITRGDNFYITGGSKSTHKSMSNKVMEFKKVLGKRGKTLDDISDEEIDQLAHKVGLKIFKKNKDESFVNDN